MYVGTQGEKKIWLTNLQQTIEKNLIGNQAPTENINTGKKMKDLYLFLFKYLFKMMFIYTRI